MSKSSEAPAGHHQLGLAGERAPIVGLIAIVLSGGCEIAGSSDHDNDNRAPVVEPLALTSEEDQNVRFTLVATDEDGDDLELIFYSSAAGSLEIKTLSQTAGRIEAEILLRQKRDFHGTGGFAVDVSDGTARTEAFISIEIEPVNDRPVGVADSVAASPNTALDIYPSTLLANDSDVDGTYGDSEPDRLSITNVGTPQNGTVTLGADTITFVPNSNFAGTATFEYTVSDGIASDVATVAIAVGAPNAAPIATDDIRQMFDRSVLVLEPPELTENDVDIDGQSLAVIAVNNATHGTVTAVGGVVTFTSEGDFTGTGGFDYVVTDGVATDTGHVTIQIAQPI